MLQSRLDLQLHSQYYQAGRGQDFQEKQAFLVTHHPPGDQLFYLQLRLVLAMFLSLITCSKDAFLK